MKVSSTSNSPAFKPASDIHVVTPDIYGKDNEVCPDKILKWVVLCPLMDVTLICMGSGIDVLPQPVIELSRK